MADPVITAWTLAQRERQRIASGQQSVMATGRLGLRTAAIAKQYAPELAGGANEVVQESNDLSRSMGGRGFGMPEDLGYPIIGKAESFLEGAGNVLTALPRGISSMAYGLNTGQNPLKTGLQGLLHPQKSKLWGETLEAGGMPHQVAGPIGTGLDWTVDPANLAPVDAIANVGGKALAPLAKWARSTKVGGEVIRGLENVFVTGARWGRMGLPEAKQSFLKEQQAAFRSGVGRTNDKLYLDLSTKLGPANVGELSKSMVHGHLPYETDRLDTIVNNLTTGAAESLRAGDKAKFANQFKMLEQFNALRKLSEKAPSAEGAKALEFMKEYYHLMPDDAARENFRRAAAKMINSPTDENKLKFAKTVHRTLIDDQKRKFTAALTGLSDDSGNPLVWDRKLMEEKAPPNYVRTPKSVNKLFGGQRMRFHPELAAELRDMPYIGDMDKFMQTWTKSAVGKGFDKLTSRWKSVVTGLSMSFHVRNFMTNQWLIFQSEGMGALRYFSKAADIIEGKAGEITLGGTKYTYDEIRKRLLESGIHRSGAMAELTGEKSLEAALKGGGKQNLGEKAIDFSRNFGNKVEDHAKTQLFMAALERSGGDVQYALNRTRKFLFDYSDLTYVEREYLRRIFPFYTWLRKNAPLQVEMMLANPARASVPFKMTKELPVTFLKKDEREEAIKQPKADFIGEQLGQPIKRNPEGVGFTYYTPNYFPLQDLADVTHPVRGLSQRIHPLASVVLDALSGEEAFRGLPLKQESGLPTEVRAGPIAAPLAIGAKKLGVSDAITSKVLGTRVLPSIGTAGSPEVRQDIRYQLASRALPFVGGMLPGSAGLGAQAALASPFSRAGGKMLGPMGPSRRFMDPLLRATGTLPIVRGEPDAAFKARAGQLMAKAQRISQLVRQQAGWRP